MNTNNLSQKTHLVLAITGLVILVIFTLQNSEVVTVRFLFWTVEMSRVILILVLLLTGFVSGYITRSIQKG